MPRKYVLRTALIIALLAVFVGAGWTGGANYPVDVALARGALAWRAHVPQLTGAVISVTHLGSFYVTLGGGLLIALGLGVRGHHRRAITIAAAVLGERILVDGIKLLLDRARPAFDLHPVATHSASFPSGHAANSMAVFLTVALIAAPARWRMHAVILALTLSFLIGLSRIYLGVHWPSDVVAGWALGAAVAIVAAQVARSDELRAAKQEHQIMSGHRPTVDEG